MSNYNFNIRGLEPGDTIIIPYNGIDTEFVVLGRNINPNPGEDYNFIDIMSKELLIPVGTPWKKEIIDTTLDDPGYKCLNYTKSDIIKELHSKLELFPQEIQDAVVSRKMRFLNTINIETNERGYTTKDVGKVWLPSIKEITNDCYMSDADPEAQQYPYFKNRSNRRLGDWWWTSSARAFDCFNAYFIYSDGGRDCGFATDSDCGSPLCLRIRIN